MQFRIEPKEIKDVATKLFIDVKIADDTATVEYRLDTEDGAFLRGGTKEIPLDKVGIVLEQPINITTLNAVLAEWGVVAVEKL